MEGPPLTREAKIRALTEESVKRDPIRTKYFRPRTCYTLKDEEIPRSFRWPFVLANFSN